MLYYDTCVMELTSIGCVERTAVLSGGGAMEGRGSSGIVPLTCVYAPISLPHVPFNYGSW